MKLPLFNWPGKGEMTQSYVWNKRDLKIEYACTTVTLCESTNIVVDARDRTGSRWRKIKSRSERMRMLWSTGCASEWIFAKTSFRRSTTVRNQLYLARVGATHVVRLRIIECITRLNRMLNTVNLLQLQLELAHRTRYRSRVWRGLANHSRSFVINVINSIYFFLP